MVNLSTLVIFVGVVLLFVPVPPIITTAIGVVVILVGVVLRWLTNV